MTAKSEEPKPSIGTTVKVIAYCAVLLVIITGILALAGWELSKLLATVILVSIGFAAAILGSHFPFIKESTDRLIDSGGRFVAWMAITWLPLVGFNELSKFMITRLDPWLQVGLFAIWGLVLAGAILLIATEGNREWLFTPKSRLAESGLCPGDPGYIGELRSDKNAEEKKKFKLGAMTPLVYAFDLLAIAMMFFATVTYVVVQQGWVVLRSAPDVSISYDSIMGFYLWHFLEAVPLLKVNDTLQWKAPLTYESGWMGLVLLTFKLAVIIPVIAAFSWYWKKVSESDPKSK